jgi:hypothetical protein
VTARVVVGADHQPRHGQDNARECARRWAAAGREVEVLIPNIVGQDFNDIIRASP